MSGDIESQNENNDEIDDHQSIFEERFATLMNGFGETCEANNVQTAIAIAIHPEEEMPIVFIRGGEYDTARLLAYVLKGIRQQINRELDTNPK